MFEIDFGPAGGGILPYSDNREVRDHAKFQVAAWEDFISLNEIRQVEDGEQIGKIVEPWKQIASEAVDQGPAGFRDAVIRLVDKHRRRDGLVAWHSPAGESIRRIVDELGAAAVIGPVRMFTEKAASLNEAQFRGAVFLQSRPDGHHQGWRCFIRAEFRKDSGPVSRRVIRAQGIS